MLETVGSVGRTIVGLVGYLVIMRGNVQTGGGPRNRHFGNTGTTVRNDGASIMDLNNNFGTQPLQTQEQE
ncbi:hypothetical protein LINPERHAP2_LOCUS3271 [Linum perenne]